MTDETMRGHPTEQHTADEIPGVKSREPDDGRVTKRMLAEGQIEKVLTDRTTMVPVAEFGLRFENAMQMAEAAKLMATAGPLLPTWLQGNPGGCWAIMLRSTEIGISPLTLAAMSFVTEKTTGGVKTQRIGWDSSYFRTLVEKYAPIKGRLQARYQGEGDDLVCIVFATFKGESEPRQFPPPGTEKDFTLAKLHPGRGSKEVNGEKITWVKGSPLWDSKPPLQMFYAMSRDWARMYCTDIVAGVYTREELIEQGFTDVVQPSDLSPRLRERLRGPIGDHDMSADIDAAIRSARVDSKKSGAASAPAGEAAPSPSAAPSEGDGAVAATNQQQQESTS
jgi:hypothetical protein